MSTTTTTTTTTSPWDPPLQQSYFPTSDLRFAEPPLCPLPPPQLPLARPPSHSTASKYSNLLPRRTQIEPGVWSDGSDRVLSAACPSVQAFLNCARRTMSLPPAPSESVFALAALDVFYHIDDPAHWIFWNNEKKLYTAEVVSRISLHRPQLIQSRVAWNGTPEYLFILSSLHGTSSLPVYENKEWYPILNPSKVPSPPRVINLRKRRVHQVEQTDPSETFRVEEVEPRPKRVKSISNPKRQPSPSVSSVDAGQGEMCEESSVGTSITSIQDAQAPSVPFGDDDDTAPDTPPITARNKTRRGCQSLDEADPNPTRTSVLLTPAAESHCRNRSISQASSQTVVSARDRRSVSVLSAITAVEILTPLGEEMMGVDQIPSDTESKEEGMVTRGRANKNRLGKEGARRPGKRAKRKGGVK